ncbi:MAG: DUF4185 domain-containing protein [bacterium]|nr:DUF4185 domain-containing protein [bacterium]
MRDLLLNRVHPWLSVVALLFLVSISLAQDFSVVPYPEYNAFIAQTTGWTGADGAYSVPLSDKVTLWLYSDTWIGGIVNGKHHGGTIINNSIALQQGKDPRTASLKFYWRKDKKGKPIAFFIPRDGNGWFWLQAGIKVDKKLYVFLSQIVKTEGDQNSIWNFKGVGTWLAEIANPLDNPLKWRIKQYKVPFGQFDGNSTFFFGAAVLKDKQYLYIYGCKDEPSQWIAGRNMILARVPAKKIMKFNQWRFYHNGNWVSNPAQCSYLFNGIAPEYSVNYLPYLNQYVCIYTELGMSNRIMMRTAPKPVGPWSQATSIYLCPEYSWNSTYFCYAAKAHPELTESADELIITYVCNSFDFWQMVGDSRIYFPRYLKLKFKS